MLFGDPWSPWYVAFADAFIVGLLFILTLIAVTLLIAELIHWSSGHNGTRPTVFWYREALNWWKHPNL